MKTALKKGAGIQNGKGPRRQPPAKAQNRSVETGNVCSAPALDNQPPSTSSFWQTRDAFGFGNVICATTEKENHAELAQVRAAGARAGHTLAQLRRVLRHRGLKHPPPELREAWLRIGTAQYGAVSASRPRWTFGLHNWVRRYFPEVWRTWPAERIDAFAKAASRECARLSPEEKGALLRIDRETYLTLGLSDFWPAGMTLEEREEDQRQARNARDRASDLASGRVKTPHAQSITRQEPWLELGISPRTYWRWKKQGRLPEAA